MIFKLTAVLAIVMIVLIQDKFSTRKKVLSLRKVMDNSSDNTEYSAGKEELKRFKEKAGDEALKVSGMLILLGAFSYLCFELMSQSSSVVIDVVASYFFVLSVFSWSGAIAFPFYKYCLFKEKSMRVKA